MNTHFIRNFRRISMKHLAIDVLLIFISIYLSLYMRVGFDGLHEYLPTFNKFTPLFIALRVVTLIGFGVYLSMWRYISILDALNLAKAIAISTLLFFAVSYILPNFGLIPRSFYFIDAALIGMLLMSVRMARRMLFERYQKSPTATGPRLKTLIYGAGLNGRDLASRFYSDPNSQYEMIGFIDDDPTKKDKVIGGFRVWGNKSDLHEILEATKAQQLIIAISHPHGDLLRELVSIANQFNIQPQVITDLSPNDLNRKNISLFRKVQLADLLNRQVADIDVSSIQSLIQGKTVLVTGAGGSIGSEIARQVAKYNPRTLLLLDHSEYNLYEIDQELRVSKNQQSNIIPVLMDIKDHGSLSQIFKKYTPEVIFHAAAYKHVHLVEANPLQAVLNNIQGTKNLLLLAQSEGVSTFVNISTDKAVNPVGVMGATKRVCELLTSSFGLGTQKKYCSVRFGNVLGSSGSLVPLLQKQILEGGPITLTHQDMTRYFMLIPEAVALVLMSATVAHPGDINVLKMGEPIKILDLTKSLLTLMGKTEKEIPILFTGLRPGEKMYEELYLCGNELTTKHPDILTLPKGDHNNPQTQNSLNQSIDKLLSLALAGSKDCIPLLHQIVKESSIAQPSEKML